MKTFVMAGKAIGNGSNIAMLAAALYALATHGDCPEWIQGAARELCRDYHVKPVELNAPYNRSGRPWQRESP